MTHIRYHFHKGTIQRGLVPSARQRTYLVRCHSLVLDGYGMLTARCVRVLTIKSRRTTSESCIGSACGFTAVTTIESAFFVVIFGIAEPISNIACSFRATRICTKGGFPGCRRWNHCILRSQSRRRWSRGRRCRRLGRICPCKEDVGCVSRLCTT